MSRRSAALRHFRHVDPHFYSITHKYHASLPKRLFGKKTRAQLFESLISTVISQQLGLAAADAIFSRVKKACGNRLTPESVLQVRREVFRKAGLSGAKVKTLKAIATAVKSNSLDLLSLKKIPEAEAAEKLMAIWGLGPWSVQMFLMFALGRPDVFSPGDLGLVRAMETIYNLPRNVSRTSLLVIAQKWSPHRTYASLLLWRSRDSR
ncbi:MAG TPA: DNA-3-methyladenine glycosylase 2 family protein [Candidatus Paceibacterota bacterium]|nr:DNA-3-methyladenine glycosylase 2 family protein [Candidatus Paceibacterota bacterium]